MKATSNALAQVNSMFCTRESLIGVVRECFHFLSVSDNSLSVSDYGFLFRSGWARRADSYETSALYERCANLNRFLWRTGQLHNQR